MDFNIEKAIEVGLNEYRDDIKIFAYARKVCFAILNIAKTIHQEAEMKIKEYINSNTKAHKRFVFKIQDKSNLLAVVIVQESNINVCLESTELAKQIDENKHILPEEDKRFNVSYSGTY